MIRLLVAVLLFALFAVPSLSQESDSEPKPTAIEAAPVRVSLFKNGYGFVTSRATLRGTGPYVVTPLPQATLGTFWLRWPGGVKIDNVVAAYENSTEHVAATNFQQLLEANIGNTVELELSGGTEPAKLRGILRDYPLLPDTDIPQRGTFILLQTDSGTAAIPTSSILRVFIVGDGAAFETEVVKREPALRFDAVVAADVAAIVEVDTLAQGIAWAPSYAVDLTADEKEATFTAKAIIVNDLVHMENVATELIAGFPHLQFAPVPSAMSLMPLDQLLQRMRHSDQPNARDMLLGGQRIITNQSAAYYDYDSSAIPSMPTSPVMGEQSEDLYFYQVKDVTLAKGERGYYPLFQAAVPFEHRYTWDVPSYLDENDNYRRPDPQQSQEVVWHVLKLTNTTDRPWTTAPASTTKAGRLLGQDTLHYTPPGQSTDLRITQALGVRAEQNEYETERQREAARYYGRRYDLVTYRGELAVVNHTPRAVTLKITKQVAGELQEADGEPEAVKLGTALRGVNPQTRLTWVLDVEPGKDGERTLAYTFQVYVPN